MTLDPPQSDDGAPQTFPEIDLHALAAAQGADLDLSLALLEALYDNVDAILAQTSEGLDLPCHKGCSMCCRECIFLTPLEFYGVWHWVQQNLPHDARQAIIHRGLALYQQHKDAIEAFSKPPPEGEEDHFSIAKDLRFDCPLLGDQGQCLAYPMRELLSRLFGCSFQPDGDVYGCHLVRTHLFGQEVTLLPAQSPLLHLKQLPLTDTRQVYPYYIHTLFVDQTSP